ncbi:MAG: tetratricopeptide repeat protein [Planctomycetota bacterium]|jgi:tetratricopeptide (TPR) repeat protein
MRLVLSSLLLLAACVSDGKGLYVPGGEGLDKKTRRKYREAVRLERRGEVQEARRILDDLCGALPLRLGIHLHRLRLVRKLEGPDAAARLYDPPPPGIDAERAGILVEIARLPADDPAKRKAILEYAATREPAEPFWKLGLADAALTAHDLLVERARSERALGAVQAEVRSLAEARAVLDRARSEAQAAADLDPKLAEAQLMLGFIETRAADVAPDPDARDEHRNKAVEHCERCLKLNPDSLDGRINLAEAYLYFNRYGKAAEVLTAASEMAPRDPRIWNNLGYTYYAVGQLGEAINCYEQALLYAPDDVRIRVALSDCERRRGQTEEAVKQLERARGEAGGDKQMLSTIAFKLAAIHEFEGRYSQAVEEYERYIKLGGPHAAKARSRVRYIYEHAFE